ncbi:MAG: exodeoxyribonuclease III [Deltaproteobacteria bacterium]|nr:exodeoxyribonuclease III [Deltaproteobacteria bacterium]
MRTLKLISWNVNGLRAVHKKGFLEWFRQEAPDMLCLQETKSSPDQLPDELLNVNGYTSFFSSAEKKGYSGVAIYSRQEPVSVNYGFGDQRFDSEGRILIVEYPEYTLFNVYYPNGGASPERLRYKMDFYEAFQECAREYRNRGRKLIVCGDVNTAHRAIDLARPKENEKNTGFLPEERAWIDRFLADGFIDTFRLLCDEGGHYSWWDYKTRARERNIGWRIDYFFVSDDLKKQVKNAWILSGVPGSDHCPIGLSIAV